MKFRIFTRILWPVEHTLPDHNLPEETMNAPFVSRFYIKATARVLLVVAGCCWLFDVCQTSQAAPPWLFGGRFTGWGFLGREQHEGPQALGGTWYNFPSGAAVEGTIVDGAVPNPCPG